MVPGICYGVLAIITLSCCSAAKQQLRNVPAEKLSLNAPADATNKIVFLTFRITATDTLNSLFDIKLVNTILADGSLKKNDFPEQPIIEPNYLYYRVTGGDVKGKDKHFGRVENPLLKVYEYPSEGKKLEKRTIVQNSGEMVIRFQYDQDLKSISIFRPDRRSLTLKPIYHGTF